MKNETMRTTVIHHSADFDGLFCREIARNFLPDAKLVGWDYGDQKIPVPTEGVIYILDLNPECLSINANDIEALKDRIIWIDHHASAIKSLTIYDIPGYRIDGVAACRLAWQWFSADHADFVVQCNGLPDKQSFIDRKVSEPLAVRLAGEYDIWDKRDPRAELFQFGLRSQPLSENIWSLLLSDSSKRDEDGSVGIGLITVEALLENGGVLQYARGEEYREVIISQGFDLEFEGLKFLACNSHECDIRSQLFEAGIKPHHDGLLGFTFTGKDWRVSLYGVPGKPEIDMSAIAVKHGGGGHRGAAGFRAGTLPFISTT